MENIDENEIIQNKFKALLEDISSKINKELAPLLLSDETNAILGIGKFQIEVLEQSTNPFDIDNKIEIVNNDDDSMSIKSLNERPCIKYAKTPDGRLKCIKRA